MKKLVVLLLLAVAIGVMNGCAVLESLEDDGYGSDPRRPQYPQYQHGSSHGGHSH